MRAYHQIPTFQAAVQFAHAEGTVPAPDYEYPAEAVAEAQKRMPRWCSAFCLLSIQEDGAIGPSSSLKWLFFLLP